KRLDLALPPELFARLERDGLSVLRDFELPPGTYQARLLGRDAPGGTLGTARHTFPVPPADGLRTSTPILTDAVQNESGRDLPVPLARRHFASGSRAFFLFAVYGALGRGGGGVRQRGGPAPPPAAARRRSRNPRRARWSPPPTARSPSGSCCRSRAPLPGSTRSTSPSPTRSRAG